MSKLLNVESKLAALIAVGTSICGATAIVATGPVIKAKKEEITYAIANITIFGIIAMLAYPYLAHYLFSGNDQSIGLFLGSEYRKCTDRKKQNQNYRNDFRLMNENLLTEPLRTGIIFKMMPGNYIEIVVRPKKFKGVFFFIKDIENA